MPAFFHDLLDPSLTFLRHAWIAGLLASLALGPIGAILVARRISYLAGALAHAVLGGIGVAVYLRHTLGWSWLTPQAGAIVAALLAATLISGIRQFAREREDSLIGILWTVGMAIGLLFLAITPGYHDLSGYLFGNILLLNSTDLWLTLLLAIAVCTATCVWYKELVAVSFDEEFARLRGLRAAIFQWLMLTLTSLCVVLLIPVTGVILVIALVTLPAAAAGHFARRLWHMMLGASLLSVLATSTGLATSYSLDLPTGPMMVLAAAALYALALLGRQLLRLRRKENIASGDRRT